MSKAVLEYAPIGIDDEHAVVPDAFKVIDLVLEHACFPCPFTHCDLFAGFFVDQVEVVEFREWFRLVGLNGVPLNGCAHRLVVCFVWCLGFVEFVFCLASHPEIGFCQGSEGGVTRAIDEDLGVENESRPRFDVLGDNGLDGTVFHVCLDDPEVRERGDVGFVGDDVQLFLILVEVPRLRIAAPERAEFLDKVAEVDVRPGFDPSAQVDPDLG